MSSPDKPDEPQDPVEPPSSEPGSTTTNVDAFYGVPPSPEPAVAPTEPGSSEAQAVPPEDAAATSEHAALPAVLVDSDERPPIPVLSPDEELRDAVGAPSRRKRIDTAPADADEDGDGKKMSRRTMMISAAAIVVGLGVATLVLLGRANSQRYMIACTTDHVSAEQGRSFPPWGTRPMSGAEWKSIPLPADGECTPRETEDVSQLEGWYLDLLVNHASAMLTSPNLIDGTPVATTTAGQPVTMQTPLDAVAEQLNQALLLSRAPARRDQRKDVERLLGDVQYWRASLRLRAAAAGLLDASRQFDAAAAQRPRHVTDAAAWGAFLRKLSDELQAGPNGAPTTAPAGPATTPIERPSAPAGVALPVEPPAEPSESEVPAATPDAGVPSGGVLL